CSNPIRISWRALRHCWKSRARNRSRASSMPSRRCWWTSPASTTIASCAVSWVRFAPRCAPIISRRTTASRPNTSATNSIRTRFRMFRNRFRTARSGCTRRAEGVHLRFGPVARGGIRWSDRREDFRTEVLGLVKAQMVKNTVIVPVGSKGGFFVKRPPADRDALLEEGIACYKMFINGLLDITDNIDTAANKVLHPADVVRHDADDPYLVVAADKGTAKFSDIANGLSIEHGYWLGDAFASGGSAGFDHKDMGITSRGGWESVMYHFRTLG